MGQPIKALSMKILKILYYLVIVVFTVIAILMIVSIFPITGNYKLMVVQSGSMEPAIKMGSVVVVKPADDYKIGDVISFYKTAKTADPITHRIYDIKVAGGEPNYITKGDANNAPDQKEVKKKEIIGKVLADIPYFGYVVDFAKTPFGFSLIIIIPAGLIIYDEAKKIYEEIKKRKKKNE